MTAPAAAVGRRVLGEIEETTLDEVLTTLRASTIAAEGSSSSAAAAATAAATSTTNANSAAASAKGKAKVYPIPALNDLAARHLRATQSATVSMTGRYEPLLYLLIATLLMPPHNKALVVIDFEGTFDVTQVLLCRPYREPGSHGDSAAPAAGEGGGEGAHSVRSKNGGQSSDSESRPPRVKEEDLEHIYIFTPPFRHSAGIVAAAAKLRKALAAAERYMLYGPHSSYGREWWGTIVIGGGAVVAGIMLDDDDDTNKAHSHHGGGAAARTATRTMAGVDIAAGWSGWLEVAREEIRGFGPWTNAEDMMKDRGRWKAAVAKAGWTAESVWGGFTFHTH